MWRTITCDICNEESTLKSRWHLLNKHCQWFCGNYELTATDKKNGGIKTYFMDDAHKLFVQLHQYPFALNQNQLQVKKI